MADKVGILLKGLSGLQKITNQYNSNSPQRQQIFQTLVENTKVVVNLGNRAMDGCAPGNYKETLFKFIDGLNKIAQAFEKEGTLADRQKEVFSKILQQFYDHLQKPFPRIDTNPSKQEVETHCNKLVSVAVIRGRNLIATGTTADSGLSDPYCVVEIPITNHKDQTQYIEQTINPEWREHFEFVVKNPAAKVIHFSVFDKEFGNQDEPMGSAVFDFSKVPENTPTDVWLPLNDVTRGEINVLITVEKGFVDFIQGAEIEAEIISECKRTHKKWEDPDFPATDYALFKNLEKKAHSTDSIEWKRPSEYTQNPQLFVEGIEPGDVIQGRLGDCYFLGALSTVATREDLLYPLFVSKHAEYGFYQVKFYKNGNWHIVTVDDRIPCEDDVPIYARCKDNDETWVPIIEKAYAKLHGSYEALNSGNTAMALTDLTGEFCSNFQFSKIASEIQSGQLWKKLQWFRDEEYLMGCSCNAGANDTELDNGMGILKNHAYGILTCKEPYQGLRLLSLRNPWGHLEWRGAYADNAPEWTPELKKMLNQTDADDGIFWMTFEDWIKNYTNFNVLRLLQDEVGDKWFLYSFANKWKGVSAGGCSNYATWNKNPQFALQTNEATKLFICLTQPDMRMNNGSNKYSVPMGFTVVQHADLSRPKLSLETTDTIIGATAFVPTRDVTHEVDLPANSSFVLVPSTFHPHQETRFWVSVFSQKPLAKVEEILPFKVQVTRGEWKGTSAGGCFNHPTWINNPVYVLKCPPLAVSEFPVKVTISVKQAHRPNLEYIGFYTGKYTNQNIFKVSDVKRDRQCTNAPEVTMEFSLAANDFPFWIMPTTFDPLKETQFELGLYCRHRLDVEKIQ